MKNEKIIAELSKFVNESSNVGEAVFFKLRNRAHADLFEKQAGSVPHNHWGIVRDNWAYIYTKQKHNLRGEDNFFISDTNLDGNPVKQFIGSKCFPEEYFKCKPSELAAKYTDLNAEPLIELFRSGKIKKTTINFENQDDADNFLEIKEETKNKISELLEHIKEEFTSHVNLFIERLENSPEIVDLFFFLLSS